MLMRQYEIF